MTRQERLTRIRADHARCVELSQRAVSRGLSGGSADTAEDDELEELFHTLACDAGFLLAEVEAVSPFRDVVEKLPRYAFDQSGSIYGPVDPDEGTFIRNEDLVEAVSRNTEPDLKGVMPSDASTQSESVRSVGPTAQIDGLAAITGAQHPVKNTASQEVEAVSVSPSKRIVPECTCGDTLGAVDPMCPAHFPSRQPKPDVRRIIEALGFDPTNHHNAAKCPYCTPEASRAGSPAQPNNLEK